MGKPIIGSGKQPIGKNGIIVAGAKLSNGVVKNNLHIKKQRSNKQYDLIQDTTIFYKLTITHIDANGKELDLNKSDSELTSSLAPGTFFVRTINSSGEQLGFATKFQKKKIINSIGKSIFNPDYSKGTDGIIKVQSIKPSFYSARISYASVLQLNYTILPENATNKKVTYKSSNTGVATVSSTGRIVTVYPGTAFITISTEDGSKSTTVILNVTW